MYLLESSTRPRRYSLLTMPFRNTTGQCLEFYYMVMGTAPVTFTVYMGTQDLEVCDQIIWII